MWLVLMLCRWCVCGLLCGRQTGELDLPWALPEWNPDKHFLVTVLTFLKKIFYMKDFRHHHQDHGLSASSSRQPRPPFNPEAYRL